MNNSQKVIVGIVTGIWLTVLASVQSFAQEPVVYDYAEPEDKVKTYRYTSKATGVQPWDIEGKLIESPAGTETVNGYTWQVRTQKTEGLPETFYKESKVYYRDATDGLYSGYFEGDANSAFFEYLQLPAVLKPGVSWKGAPDFWDHESLQSIGAFNSPAGSFERCLFTVRTTTREEPVQKLYSETVICPQVGGVRTIIKTTMDGFESTTEMLLVSLQ